MITVHGLSAGFVPQRPTQIDDQVGHRLIAFSGVLLQRFFCRDPKSDWNRLAYGLGCSVDDGLQNVEIRGALEWSLSSKQFIQNDAKGKDIAASIQRLAGGLLR